MRYKFSLAPKIKGYVEWQLEHYHEDKRQMEEYKRDMMPPGVANYSGMWGGSEPGDPTAATAIRLLTNPYIVAIGRNVKAIERILERGDETDRKLIELVYWRQTYTIVGAGLKVGLSKSGAYNRVNDILCGIALEMGLVSA